MTSHQVCAQHGSALRDSFPRGWRTTSILELVCIALASVLIPTPHTRAELLTQAVGQSRLHYAGDIWLNVQAFGTIGSGPGCFGEDCQYNSPPPREDLATLKIDWQPSLEFPGGSKTNYLYLAAPMVGCIEGIDTLVSTAFCSLVGFPNEFNAFSKVTEASSQSSSPYFSSAARADQEYHCTYSDTAVLVGILPTTLDGIDRRIHKPIGLEVSQTSRAWSDGYSRRFVIFNLWIRNISGSKLRQPCIGITVWTGTGNYEASMSTGGIGSMCGYLNEVPLITVGATSVSDTLHVAWTTSANGGPTSEFTSSSPRAVAGFQILRSPPGPVNFNWWGAITLESPWGPHRTENLRDHSTQFAWPYGDKSLYQLMTNGEVDYDNMYSAINFQQSGWERPPSDPYFVEELAAGRTGQFLHLSCGPFSDMAPGDSVPFTYAVIVGDNFHTKPDNYAVNFVSRNPQRYRENLDFSDLINSARAADWFFDNPGIDTDGDGYAGKFALVNCTGPDQTGCDTIWYKGDGIPDWGGQHGPPSPSLELTSQPNQVTLSWTGAVSETAVDRLSRRRDFEGYRVYTSRVNTVGQYALIAAWDIPDNFHRFAYDPLAGRWKQISYPQTIEEWRRELGDPEFDPAQFAHASLGGAYRDLVVDTVRDVSGAIIRIEERERLSYWVPQGPNFGNTYPVAGQIENNRIQRTALRDTIIGDDTLQYGVYEFTLDNLSSSVPLWFTVTALDHGDYRRNVEALEGGVGANAQFAFPVFSADAVVDSGLKVSVYPNPYKILYKDGMGNTTNYYAQGFEGYGLPRMDERERRIWFANLPDTATIRIYSLDGDLIREIHHPDPFLTRYSSMVGWDLISRNTQAVVSGLYIWRVDSRLGKQIGKIAIIK